MTFNCQKVAYRQNPSSCQNWCAIPTRNRSTGFGETGSADWPECFRPWCHDGWLRVGGKPEPFQQLAEEIFSQHPLQEILSRWWSQRGPCKWGASPWSGCKSLDVRRSLVTGQRQGLRKLFVGGRSREERTVPRTEIKEKKKINKWYGTTLVCEYNYRHL